MRRRLAALRSVEERVRSSFLFVPVLSVVAAVGVAAVTLYVDRDVDGFDSLPLVATPTASSAREILSTVAGATITVAGIAFSVSLLVIQLASGQHAPQIVHSMYRDPYNRRVIGVVVGTFAFCLVTLLGIRSPEIASDPPAPTLSVLVAVLLGVVSTLAIVAFINHSAHSMDVGTILQRALRQSVEQSLEEPADVADDASSQVPDGVAATVRAEKEGWLQGIDVPGLLRSMPDGTTVRLRSWTGRYVIAGAPLADVWPPAAGDEVGEAVRAAAVIGTRRTVSADPSYGLTQLVEVAQRALSPGVNNPATAREAVSHVGALLADTIRRPPPARAWRDGGRRAFAPLRPTHADIVDLAFDDLRPAVASIASVAAHAVEVLADVRDAVGDDADATATARLADHAALLLAASTRALDDPNDVRMVRDAVGRRFRAV